MQLNQSDLKAGTSFREVVGGIGKRGAGSVQCLWAGRAHEHLGVGILPVS